MKIDKSINGFDHAKGIAGIGVTVIAWSFSDLWVSYVNVGLTNVIYQSALAILILSCILAFTRKKLSLSNFKALLPLGLSRTLGMSSLYLAIKDGNVSVIMTIVACATLLTASVFAPLIGEKIDGRIVVLLSFAVVGIVFASRGNPANINWQFSESEVYALICMTCFAYSTVLVRKTSLKVEPISNVFYMYSWMFILSLPILFVYDIFNIENIAYKLDTRQFLFMISIAVASVIGHVVLTWAQKRTTVTMASMLAPAAAVFTAFIAVSIKGDSLNSYQIFGIALIVLSISIASQIEARRTTNEKILEINEVNSI